MSTPEDLLADRYRLQFRLGTAEHGEVWRARDTSLGRDVVVRFADAVAGEDAGAVERFRSEATTAASLTHRHAVTIYDVGDSDGRPFVVMELVEGIGLSLLIRRGPIDPAFVALLGRDIAAALGSAHRRGVVHGDVRPANILLSVTGEAKLRGFGFADTVVAPSAAWRPPADSTGEAAEQAGGPDGHADGGADGDTDELAAVGAAAERPHTPPRQARGDVYSLGLVLHACLTGWRPPQRGAARGLVPDLRDNAGDDCPEELLDAVARATDPDEQARFASGDELAAALQELVTPTARDRLAATVEPLAENADATEGSTTSTRAITPAPARQEARAGASTTAAMPTAPTTSTPGPGGPAQPQRHQTRPTPARGPARVARQWGPWLREHRQSVAAGVLALVAAGALGALVLGGSPGPDRPGEGATGGAASPDGEPVAITQAGDFDPYSGGEHPEEVANAVDGDPATTWGTEQYNTARLGGLKPGVGLWVELSAATTPAAVELDVVSGPIDLELYLGEDPPAGTDPSAWGTRLASRRDVSGTVTIEPAEQASGRYLLVWITELAPSNGRYAAELAEIRLLPGG